MPDINRMPDTSKGGTGNQNRIEAMIRYNNSGYHRHVLREIGTTGAFLEMGNARVLRPHTRIQVVFVHRNNGAANTHLVDARIGRVEKNGARLIFSNLDVPAWNALSEMSRRGHTAENR